MKKILVIGSCGAGKTYFADILSNRLNRPVVHLDHLFWLPDWTPQNQDIFDQHLKAELEKPEWIIDGNYNRTLPLRLQFADTVIHLSYNRWICLYRIVKRQFSQSPQAAGCSAKIDFSFLWYVFWKYPREHQKATKKLKEQNAHINWIEFKGPKETKKYISSL